MIASNCVHCLHPTGRRFSLRPEIVEKRCCNCGTMFYIKEEQTVADGEHGPYAPKLVKK